MGNKDIYFLYVTRKFFFDSQWDNNQKEVYRNFNNRAAAFGCLSRENIPFRFTTTRLTPRSLIYNN